MYKSVKHMCFLRGGANDGLLFSPVTFNWFNIFRSASGMTDHKVGELKETSHEKTFTSILEKRKNQARRSIIVKMPSFNGWEKLIHLVSTFGSINKVMHYEVVPSNYMLVEMKNESDVNDFLKAGLSIHPNPNSFNQFLSFNASVMGKVPSLGKDIVNKILFKVPITLQFNQIMNPKYKDCTKANIVSEIHRKSEVTDFELRLKFLTCRQIEVMISGLLPNCRVYPFGSSVSGFGITGCDLDLVILTETVDFTNPFYEENLRFINIDRTELQTQLGTVYEVLKRFGKGCKGLNFVKHAKVPIIRFKQTYTSVECDLSMYSNHVLYMSQLFFTLSSCDECVKPLVLILKLWAQKLGLVLKIPMNTYLTNFSFTLLVLYFLQQKNISVLPPLETSIPLELKVCNDSLDSMHHLVMKEKQNLKKNDKSVQELLFLFFSFYSSFDFSGNGISLKTGSVIDNVEGAPLYIEYPFQPTNVSKNVSMAGISAFQSACKDAREKFRKTKSNIFSVFENNITKKKSVNITHAFTL